MYDVKCSLSVLGCTPVQPKPMQTGVIFKGYTGVQPCNTLVINKFID